MENILPILDKFKLPVALAFLGLVLILGGVLAKNFNSAPVFPQESLVEGEKLISIDVSGAVIKPGVYRLNDSFRIEDAVKAAGGFTENANQEYISKYINMAQKLTDGSKIYIPFAGEISYTAQGQAAVTGAIQKININIASQSELESLSGVGPSTASKIISARPYQKVEDLLNKKVISNNLFEKIKNELAVY